MIYNTLNDLALEYSVYERANYIGSLNVKQREQRARGNISDSWSHLLQTVKLLIAMSIFRKLTVEFSFAEAELKLKGYDCTDASGTAY